MARLVEYLNPHPYSVQIAGPDKRIINIEKYSKVILTDWFMDRYTPKFLRVVRIIGEDQSLEPRVINTKPSLATPNKSVQVLGKRPEKQRPRARHVAPRSTRRIEVPQKFGGVRSGRSALSTRRNKKIVGRALGHAAELYSQAIQEVSVAISNEIGVGILSFNRLDSLKRLIGSIRKYTDLSRTTVFVSDESTDISVREWLVQQTDVISLINRNHLGIAGNTNRLMNCLKRFRYKILLNDDVEVLKKGWEQVYFDTMETTGFHHFCYRQDGLYGAKSTDISTTRVAGRLIRTVREKPHGAVMAYDSIAFDKIGYFDEELKHYGMEHIDWSNRVGLAELQPKGFHDIENSSAYFAIHKERSVIPNKGQFLRENRAKYERFKDDKSRIYVQNSPKSVVPSASVVIPIRDMGRSEAIVTVIQNIKAQRYPNIEIILVEQDIRHKFDRSSVEPIKYLFVANSRPNQDFNKSRAFNQGVLATTNNIVILHDADIMVQCDYIQKIAGVLAAHQACHIGSRVLYLDAPSTAQMCATKHLNKEYRCERAVGYFEGGSIAFQKKMFFKVGGFNEAYEGYGVEDCDFYERLKVGTRFCDDRSIDMFHLWHSRVTGWSNRHQINKNLAETIRREMTKEQYINQLVERMKASYPQSRQFYEKA